jgi:hypothetical protein
MWNLPALSRFQKFLRLLQTRSCSTTLHVETQRYLWQTLLVSTRQPLVLERNDWLQHFETLGKSTVENIVIETDDSEQVRRVSDIDETHYIASHSSSSQPTQRWDESREVRTIKPLPGKPRDMSKAAQFLKQSVSSEMTTTTSVLQSSVPASASRLGAMLSLSLSTTQTEQQRAHSLQREMDELLKQKNPDRAWPLFQKAVEEDLVMHFSPKVVRELFFKVFRNPIAGYHVLQAYRTMTAKDYGNDITAYADMYRQLCESIQYLNHHNCTTRDRNVVVGSLVQELQQMDRAGKELCIPVLVSSLMTQKFVALGDLAGKLYQYMRREEFQVAPGYWGHLLATSKYNRRSELPYDEIFLESVKVGRRPTANVVMNALQNYFPYTDDIAAVQRIVQGVALLQQSSTVPGVEYPVDMAMLEALSTSAAQTGMSDLIMPIWDIITILGLEPSVAIYENTIVTFCARPAMYKQAFIVLDEMQQKGHIVSRALLRSMSAQLR